MIDVQQFIESFKEHALMKNAEQEEYLKVIRTPPEGVPEDATEWEYTAEQLIAREEFLCRNIRLAIHIAKNYSSIDSPRMPDIISAACIGMIKGLDKFDLSKEVRFSTYAPYWMMSEINKYLKSSDNKVHKHKTLYATMKTLRNAYLKKKEYRTDQQLYEELGWDDAKVRSYEEDMGRLKVSLDTIDTGPKDYATVDSGLLTESPEDEILNQLQQAEERSLLVEALNTLIAIQKEVLMLRYGFAHPEGKTQTYDQVSKELGITREKVKRIENNALQALWYFMSNHAPSLREN